MVTDREAHVGTGDDHAGAGDEDLLPVARGPHPTVVANVLSDATAQGMRERLDVKDAPGVAEHRRIRAR